MTIRSVGGSAAVTFTDPTAMAMAEMQDALDAQRAASRAAQRGAQETRAQAIADRVEEMHRAADFELGAGIARGIGIASEGVAAIGDGLTQLGRLNLDAPGATPTGGEGAPAAPDRSTMHAGMAVRASGTGTRAGAEMVAGYLQSQAEHARARAAEAEERGEVSRSRADEHRDEATAAERKADRALELLDQIVQARRQAEQAALRA